MGGTVAEGTGADGGDGAVGGDDGRFAVARGTLTFFFAHAAMKAAALINIRRRFTGT